MLTQQPVVRRVLFDEDLQADGVEYLFRRSLYSADPRYNASNTDITKRVFACKEVILPGRAFNTPQLLKLSGVDPASELKGINIPFWLISLEYVRTCRITVSLKTLLQLLRSSRHWLRCTRMVHQ